MVHMQHIDGDRDTQLNARHFGNEIPPMYYGNRMQPGHCCYLM